MPHEARAGGQCSMCAKDIYCIPPFGRSRGRISPFLLAFRFFFSFAFSFRSFGIHPRNSRYAARWGYKSVLLVYLQLNKKKAKAEGKKCHAKTMWSQ
jgi:hypothetical protein